jgi:hypothetical protein
MSIMRSFAIGLSMMIGISAYAAGVPDDCTQLILGIAPTWNSMRGELRLLERTRGGDWVSVAGPFPVLFGKNGIAWGTGLVGQNEPGLRKKERDGRAPAGVFEIGQVFGYNPHLPAGGDYPYEWLIEIRHNSDPPVPGAGSAIFFHIRRGENRPTTGCTTMAKENLVKLITWLRANRHPCYALLPAAEYDKKWRSWNLPSPETVHHSISSSH